MQKKSSQFNFAKLRSFFLYLGVAFISLSVGYLIGSGRISFAVGAGPIVNLNREMPSDKDVDFDLFWQVWDSLDQNYYNKKSLSARDRVYGAISGMVASIGDPYTVFLPPDENKVVQEDLSGNFDGVGIRIGYKGSQLAVIAPLTDSPAEAAGVKAGDYIVGIIDKQANLELSTAGISLAEAVKAIRGPQGSVVTLVLLRDDQEEPIRVDITRDTIEVPSVVLTWVGDDGNIAHLEVSKFAEETKGEWDAAVREILKNSNIVGIVLDVRNDPGGYLQGAVDLASEFVETGSTVVIQENADGTKEEYPSTRLGLLKSMPVVVLVNGGSASASEILAGALRDINGTPIVGETTFGKGTIQESIQVNGGSGLHITTSKWLTPKGEWVNEKGLEPGVKVEDNPDTSEDEQLQEALRILL